MTEEMQMAVLVPIMYVTMVTIIFLSGMGLIVPNRRTDYVLQAKRSARSVSTSGGSTWHTRQRAGRSSKLTQRPF